MPGRGTFELPKEVLGIRIPDSDLARGAALLARKESPCSLFNHCMRTFILAGLFARKHEWKYDEEVVFVSAALHDLGLLKKFESAEMTFEKAGALYARDFVEKAGFSPDRADRVCKSIALHAGKVPQGSIPDVRLIQEGARIDVFGKPDFAEIVPPDVQAAILTVFPRLGFKLAFKDLLAAHAIRQPAHACWTAQFAREPPSPFVKDVLCSPWPE